MALLWKRSLEVLALFAVAVLSGAGCGKGGSVPEGRLEEETTSGGGSANADSGSGSSSSKAGSGVVNSKPLQLNRGEFYHYANNVSLPESDTYTLKAKMQPPAFLQHRTEDGKAVNLTESIVVEFENVNINTEGE